MGVATNSLDRAGTITDNLTRRWREEPASVACEFVAADGVVTPVSVDQLLAKAAAFAGRYTSRTGEPHVIGVCLPTGPDLLAAFIGGIFAGHLPTMLAPPSPRMEKAKYARSFAEMVSHIDPTHLVVDATTRAQVEGEGINALTGVDLVDPAETPDRGSARQWAAAPDDVAVLQHSSGTTGLQKGVALSHRAVLTHNALYADRIDLGPDDVIVSWLPLYHDMGFIACFLLPLLAGVPFVLMSPFDWVRRPVMLFEQIARRRGTFCWLPNFAFSFLTQGVRSGDRNTNSDLSTIRAWINCSEPVGAGAFQKFLDRFADWGVRSEQFTASYAMAENVFAVTQSSPGEYRTVTVSRRVLIDEHRAEPTVEPDGVEVVSNGRPVFGNEVRVQDETGHPQLEGRVGEIVIRGPHLFSGYFRRDDLTEAVMTPDGWYKTGDLGFLRDGETYITGRKKDLIIIQGRNFYPTDVEKVTEGVDGVVPGRTVAFGLTDPDSGTEQLIILAEVDDSVRGSERAVELRIRNAISQELTCTPGDVRVVPPRYLVKSTAGKLARNDNRNKYLADLATRRSS